MTPGLLCIIDYNYWLLQTILVHSNIGSYFHTFLVPVRGSLIIRAPVQKVFHFDAIVAFQRSSLQLIWVCGKNRRGFDYCISSDKSNASKNVRVAYYFACNLLPFQIMQTNLPSFSLRNLELQTERSKCRQR